ncbi:MAG: 4-hydroxybenzoyl-CoA reductase subunit alpha [Myxococcota bacterium]
MTDTPVHRGGRIDGRGQVTGEARYTDDIALPRMLHARILRSPHAHARIVSIDSSAAEAMPGVVAVITGGDLPIPYGILPWTQDEHALALHKVRYVGDGVAAVAAVDERTAAEAAAAIQVEYEVLEPLFDPAEAAERSDVVLHDLKRPGNITKYVKLAFGDTDAAFKDAALVLDNQYYFHGTTHAPIEPHCAVAHRDGEGLLTLWSATQVPHYVHRALSRVLELPPRAIRVIQPAVGGAFGGKSEPFDLEFVVCLLAMRTGRPVKLLYTREEVFLAHRGRHPILIDCRTAFDADGRVRGHTADLLLDGGAYASFGLVTSYYAGQLTTLPYSLPAYAYRSRRVYTNKPACGPKRGHGSVQPRFAVEVQLDRAAVALGIDPIELRRKNFIGENTRTVNGLRVGSLGLLECLDRVEEGSRWKERRAKLPRGHGLGVAASAYISGTAYCIYPTDLPQSSVQVCADRSGRVRVFCGASDIGQGSDTMLAAITAHELGVALEDIRVVSADTDLTPVDLGAYSSRITMMAGSACIEAARQVADRVRQAVATEWKCKPGDVSLADRVAVYVPDPSRSMPIVDAFVLAEVAGGALSGAGAYDTPKEALHGDYRGATIGATPAFSTTAHVAEVSVDVDTGEVKVLGLWCAHDCGKAINPQLVEGQIEGSTYMGMGEAIMENHEVSATGRLVAPGLLDYRIPTAVDTPHIQAYIVEAPDSNGPYGAKEAGEGPLHSVIPAIANAVFDAVGVRIDTLPITPEKVLAALDALAGGAP